MGGPAALAAQNAGVLAVSICSGSPKFGPQGVGNLVYTISVAVQAEGYLLAEWAKNSKKWNSVYILKDEAYTYTRSQCAGFERRWKEIAGADSIVGSDSFKNDDPSIAAQITRLKASAKKPDFIMVCSMMPGAPSAVRQIRNAGITAPITLGFSLDGDYWLSAIPNVTGVYLPVHGSVFGDDPNPAVNELVVRMKQRFGTPPTTSYALMGYSLIQAYAKAVEKAGTTESAKVAAVLDTFKDEPLLIGPRTFTKDVHIQTKVRGLIMEVKSGKLVSTGEYYANEEPVPFEQLFKE
jgi:branched-chain amino acid transport system substrate-binding protein